MQDAYPQYNLFSDISNLNSVSIYEKRGFEILEKNKSNILVQYLSEQEKIPIDFNSTIFLALPLAFDMSKIWEIPKKRCQLTIDYIKTIEDADSYFEISLFDSSIVQLVEVTYSELLQYQQFINVLYFNELRIKQKNKVILIYTTGKGYTGGLKFAEETKSLFKQKKKECKIIPDVFVSIPICYEKDLQLKQQEDPDYNFIINRILKALDFRTTVEAGIPVKELDDRNFKNRIKRKFLGYITIEIVAEDKLLYNGLEDSEKKLGEPFDVAMFVSIDKMTNCGVLHLVSLSTGFIITQLLDSISRNQLNVIHKEKTINFYAYLKQEYAIEKKVQQKPF
ncbi:MAG: hypothetical protein LUH15_02645 [Tannerellaceae bacterium]|nr:hypothetical protein [Tannerellaceae bacterium]